MTNIKIGKGKLGDKGIYANRDFKKDEIVLKYTLTPLTFKEFKSLSSEDFLATHNVNGQIYLYHAPARYVNHSDNPNVRNDHDTQADIAIRDIKAGELITVDARLDDVPLIKKLAATFVKVPNIQQGIDFYREQLGMQIQWKTEDMAAVRLGESQLILTTKLQSENSFLVESVEHAIEVFKNAGGKVIDSVEEISAGKSTVVKDPFGNKLTLVDLSKLS
jgi:predicted enzyme related to lactoylglutathione lyase